MRKIVRPFFLFFLMMLQLGLRPTAATGQVFVAVMGGSAALSAAASAQANPAVAANYQANVSGAFNAEVGYHLNDWFSVRGGYIWNENRIVTTTVGSGTFGQVSALRKQDAFSGELLLYFRQRKSWVRPYLTAGPAWVWFGPGTKIGLRVAVGVDVVSKAGWGLRYSFSEVMSGNPFAETLAPPASTNLMNFQNLFGVVKVF